MPGPSIVETGEIPIVRNGRVVRVALAFDEAILNAVQDIWFDGPCMMYRNHVVAERDGDSVRSHPKGADALIFAMFGKGESGH